MLFSTWLSIALLHGGRDALEDVLSNCLQSAGSAYNQAGRSSGLTAPNGPAQTALVRTAIQVAGKLPGDIKFASLHGTGTPLGDPIEIGALGPALNGNASELQHCVTLGKHE